MKSSKYIQKQCDFEQLYDTYLLLLFNLHYSDLLMFWSILAKFWQTRWPADHTRIKVTYTQEKAKFLKVFLNWRWPVDILQCPPRIHWHVTVVNKCVNAQNNQDNRRKCGVPYGESYGKCLLFRYSGVRIISQESHARANRFETGGDFPLAKRQEASPEKPITEKKEMTVTWKQGKL